MQLIGMLDSPYVRRVAVSLQLLGLPFTHRPLSVFRTFDEFRRINPVVKAPTLVCDDGAVLMDSTLILQHAERLAAPSGRTLMPPGASDHLRALRLTGLALAACEKSVQLVYEQTLRPAEKRHEPWTGRVTGQLRAACAELEAELVRQPSTVAQPGIDQGALTAAVAWHFIGRTLPGLLEAERHPALEALSLQAERLPAFRAAPHGDACVQ